MQIRNFTAFNKNRSDSIIASGAFSIIIKTNFISHEYKLDTDLEAIATTRTINNKTITICNIYLSNKYRINLSQLEKLITRLPKPFVLVGDFNS